MVIMKKEKEKKVFEGRRRRVGYPKTYQDMGMTRTEIGDDGLGSEMLGFDAALVVEQIATQKKERERQDFKEQLSGVYDRITKVQ